MAKFISDGVGVNSINDEDVIPEGWSVITAKAAEKIYAPLFGGVDPEAVADADDAPIAEPAPVETPVESAPVADAPVAEEATSEDTK